jgi:hypothetical protein
MKLLWLKWGCEGDQLRGRGSQSSGWVTAAVNPVADPWYHSYFVVILGVPYTVCIMYR